MRSGWRGRAGLDPIPPFTAEISVFVGGDGGQPEVASLRGSELEGAHGVGMNRAAGIEAPHRVVDFEPVVAGRYRRSRDLLEAAAVVEDSTLGCNLFAVNRELDTAEHFPAEPDFVFAPRHRNRHGRR